MRAGAFLTLLQVSDSRLWPLGEEQEAGKSTMKGVALMKHVRWYIPTLLAGLLIVLADGGVITAQETTGAAAQSVFGQITGRVFCKDSGRPARFAGVQ